MQRSSEFTSQPSGYNVGGTKDGAEAGVVALAAAGRAVLGTKSPLPLAPLADHLVELFDVVAGTQPWDSR